MWLFYYVSFSRPSSSLLLKWCSKCSHSAHAESFRSLRNRFHDHYGHEQAIGSLKVHVMGRCNVAFWADNLIIWTWWHDADARLNFFLFELMRNVIDANFLELIENFSGFPLWYLKTSCLLKCVLKLIYWQMNHKSKT